MFLIWLLKAPTLEATVGILTKAASVHLFSDLASLNTVSSNGAKLISIERINFGNSFQSTNGDVITLFFTFSISGGKSSNPTTFKYNWSYFSNNSIMAGMISLKSSLWVILPDRYPIITLVSSFSTISNASFEYLTISSLATFLFT